MRRRSYSSTIFIFKACFTLLLLALVLLFNSCSVPNPEPAPASNSTNSESNPLLISSSTTDLQLAKATNQLIDNSDQVSARWGVSVISLEDNRIVFERNGDRLFTPASNMKLFPTAVALELLGADYRWRTSVYAVTSPDTSGAVNGDLVLYGRGAPDLVAKQTKDDENNSLDYLAAELANRGVRLIRGNVIGDESYFRGEPMGEGWQWNDVQWYFGAEASALSINNNETSVNVLPPEKNSKTPLVRVGDDTGYLTVENKMAIGSSSKDRMTVGIYRELSDNVVRVWGTLPPGSKGFGARLSVHKPALWAAKLFVDSLKSHGISVQGQAVSRDSRTPIGERFDPQQATELASVSSRPLREIIKATNKFSINLYAELLLRTLGRERSALINIPQPSGRERGDEENGLAVVRLWLNRSQISTQGLALHDGSGLSRLNLTTPRALAQLLAVMSRTPNGQIFRESLPLSGRDGTLGSRLQEYADRVSAKTGYLTYDRSLSGYVTTSEGRVFSFSIMCNDDTGRANSGRMIDQIVSLLATYPAGASQKPPKN